MNLLDVVYDFESYPMNLCNILHVPQCISHIFLDLLHDLSYGGLMFLNDSPRGSVIPAC